MVLVGGALRAQDITGDSLHTRVYLEPFQYVFGEWVLGMDTRVSRDLYVGLALGYKPASDAPEEGIPPVFAGYALLTDIAAVALPYYNGHMGRVSVGKSFGGPHRTRGEVQLMYRSQEHPRLKEGSNSTVVGYFTESRRSHTSVSLRVLMERPIGKAAQGMGLGVSWFAGAGLRVRSTTVEQWTTVAGQGTTAEGPYVNEWIYPTVHLGMRFGLAWWKP